MPELTVAAAGARALWELAVSKGAGRRALAERARIDPSELQDPDGRIPLPKYVALMRAGKELCGDPAFALHFGEEVDFADLSVVGLIGRASENWVESFAQLNRYSRLVIEVEVEGDGADRFQLRRSGGQLWMVDARRNPNDFPELTESSFARMVCTSRRWLGETQFVRAVHFTHPEPPYRAEYDRIFQLPLVFGSDKNALLTDEAWMTHRNTLASPYALGVLSAHAETLLRSLESSKTTRGRVEGLLTPMLHTGEAGIDAVAGKLGVSRQTLFRRLKAEGVTFEKVLDELRHKLALHYLTGKHASVNETAYLVGFSDPAAFSRAFKRWTGSSPRAALAPKLDDDRAAFQTPPTTR
ncbi:MAG TPA: AraC family transcriptional regulator [Pyrinomonadaceae bacterium]|nr:AraC family transcriptional regulator [Pyrinomonadaceae bacterium]